MLSSDFKLKEVKAVNVNKNVYRKIPEIPIDLTKLQSTFNPGRSTIHI